MEQAAKDQLTVQSRGQERIRVKYALLQKYKRRRSYLPQSVVDTGLNREPLITNHLLYLSEAVHKRQIAVSQLLLNSLQISGKLNNGHKRLISGDITFQPQMIKADILIQRMPLYLDWRLTKKLCKRSKIQWKQQGLDLDHSSLPTQATTSLYITQEKNKNKTSHKLSESWRCWTQWHIWGIIEVLGRFFNGKNSMKLKD